MKHARPDYNRIQDPAKIIPADEPVFLLRGQDEFAPAAVRFYADRARRGGATAELVRLSVQQADAMERWPIRKSPDLPPRQDAAPPALTPDPQGRATAQSLTDRFNHAIRDEFMHGGADDETPIDARAVAMACRAMLICYVDQVHGEAHDALMGEIITACGDMMMRRRTGMRALGAVPE